MQSPARTCLALQIACGPAVAHAVPQFLSLFERIQGSIVCKVSNKTFSKLRITWAYIKLLCIPGSKSEARMVSLSRIGNYEVRMFERSRAGSADAPLFWMELFDHHAKASVDSCSCQKIEDGVPLFQGFVSQAKYSSPRGRERSARLNG